MTQTIRLDGKVALVTGASSGLGERFAMVLAEAGADVALCARRTDKMQGLAERIRAMGRRAAVIGMDVTDVAGIRAGVQQARDALGPVSILVNNSGISGEQKLVDVDEETYDRTFDTNTKGAFFVAQAVARQMIEGNVKGRIINIASVVGVKPVARIGIYSMSKAAAVMMTRAMALEWARYEINTNAICPGYIETDINRHHWTTEAGRKLIQMLPRRRIGQPEDLDGLLLLLASDEARFINGAIITADDGMSVT
ncbi:MAG TPA: SDR family oxidoreductase [Azospirillaceae bacterium]|nr:SDR family oxidoreductase [Azospirillaceae bacterium]